MLLLYICGQLQFLDLDAKVIAIAFPSKKIAKTTYGRPQQAKEIQAPRRALKTYNLFDRSRGKVKEKVLRTAKFINITSDYAQYQIILTDFAPTCVGAAHGKCIN